jgi:predicted DNA-binding transcriptional regulator AlpA
VKHKPTEKSPPAKPQITQAAWLNAEPTPRRILSYDDLKERKGIKYSRVWLDELIRQGRFPKKIRLSPNRIGWLEDQVDSILAACAEHDTSNPELQT